MRLGEVRGAIRKMKGNPILKLWVDGQVMTIVTQKTPLLEELERLYPGGKGVETPFELDEGTGELRGPFNWSTVSATYVAPDADGVELVPGDVLLINGVQTTVGETHTVDLGDDLLV